MGGNDPNVGGWGGRQLGAPISTQEANYAIACHFPNCPGEGQWEWNGSTAVNGFLCQTGSAAGYECIFIDFFAVIPLQPNLCGMCRLTQDLNEKLTFDTVSGLECKAPGKMLLTWVVVVQIHCLQASF